VNGKPEASDVSVNVALVNNSILPADLPDMTSKVACHCPNAINLSIVPFMTPRGTSKLRMHMYLPPTLKFNMNGGAPLMAKLSSVIVRERVGIAAVDVMIGCGHLYLVARQLIKAHIVDEGACL